MLNQLYQTEPKNLSEKSKKVWESRGPFGWKFVMDRMPEFKSEAYSVGSKQFENRFYEGQMNSENLQDGLGRVVYDTGCVFEGCYKKGNKHGYGRFISKDGDCYQGMFENNRRTFYGQEELSSGNTY